jgi:flagellar FliL protein
MAEDKKEEVPAGPKLVMGLPLPLFAFLAVNTLVMLGGLGFVVQASLLYKKPPITETQVVAEIQKKVEKKPEGASGLFIESYPEATINLRTQQGGKNHYASVEVSLVCTTERCVEQLKSVRAKVEDAIQSAVSARSYTELQSLDVKYRIKHEVLGRVNSFLKETAVTEVLFTNFVVQ